MGRSGSAGLPATVRRRRESSFPSRALLPVRVTFCGRPQAAEVLAAWRHPAGPAPHLLPGSAAPRCWVSSWGPPPCHGVRLVLTTIGGMRRAASRPDDRCMARLYDTVIAGCGAGGGTQACTLAPWGKQGLAPGIPAGTSSWASTPQANHWKPSPSHSPQREKQPRQTKQPRPQPLPHRRCRQPRWPTRASRYPNA